ncbi:MAG: sugar phosphate isomerase/epimerase [Veillonellaceae bacterium]|nr:sugar phosphate isomerase/epimerase [Veillonellaceae bacterium]
MKRLVNLTNFPTDLDLIDHSTDVLEGLLREYDLDGIELMLCAPWDRELFPQRLIGGCHLPFYPNWLDFWFGDTVALRNDFPTAADLQRTFGATEPEAWVERYAEDIRRAAETGTPYMVFHVANCRYREAFTWDFYYGDEAVIAAMLDLLERLAPAIPQDTWLLLENLWWPGMRLTEPEIVETLLQYAPHPKTGIMLDTGHLLATNRDLRTEREAIDYLFAVVDNLGELRNSIRGIHLHQSLSGEYLGTAAGKLPEVLNSATVSEHVNRMDYHAPWTDPAIREFVRYVDPEWVTFEFLQRDLASWRKYLALQSKAMGDPL